MYKEHITTVYYICTTESSLSLYIYIYIYMYVDALFLHIFVRPAPDEALTGTAQVNHAAALLLQSGRESDEGGRVHAPRRVKLNKTNTYKLTYTTT